MAEPVDTTHEYWTQCGKCKERVRVYPIDKEAKTFSLECHACGASTILTIKRI